MAIMAARMHDARVFAGVGQARFLGDWQSIEVGAEAYGSPTVPALQPTNKPGFGKTPMNFQAPTRQAFCDQV